MTKRSITAALLLLLPLSAAAQEPTPTPANDEVAAVPSADPAPARSTTGVRGRVSDIAGGAPVIGAIVQAPGVGTPVTTADDGTYVLVLPAGTWEIFVQQEVYKPARARNVVVEDGKLTVLDLALTFDEGIVQEMVITEKIDRRSEQTLLKERKESAVVSDSISAQEISRTPDSGAQDSVKRVTSATVQDGKYLMVRGLGGRYASTLLNGVQLPSPEPDKQAVPLDLFPNALLSSLTVAKTYGASLPGSFAGGSLQISTNSYPTAFEVKTKVSSSFDSASTFKERPGYSGGSLDFLGIDDGRRGLPGSVPTNGPLLAENDGMSASEVDSVSQDFDNNWALRDSRALPSLSLGATVGNTKYLGSGSKLGWLATVNYGHKSTLQDSFGAKVNREAGAIQYRETRRSVVGSDTGTLGVLLNTGWQANADHDVGLLTLYTHAGESRAQHVAGYSDSDAEDFDSSRLEFVQRTLSFTQFHGRHKLPQARFLEIDWQANVSATMRREPDTRDLSYTVLDDGRMRFDAQPGSGERFYSNLLDLSTGAGVNASLPTTRARLKAGVQAQRSTRKFDARRFRYDFIGSDPQVLFLGPNEIFADENLGTDFRIEERTLQADAYDASLGVYSGFAEADVNGFEAVRVIAGLRYEVADQQLTPGSTFAITDTEEKGVKRSDADLLPALNVSIPVGAETNVRGGYSYTLARPQFRELAPFLYTDFTRRRSISGNPDLVETRIHNLDLRWEWFPGATEVFSASLFGKKFERPIEQVISSANGDLSFENAAGATAWGMELEGRTSLGRIAKPLAPFRVAANVAVIESEIDLGKKDVQTSTKRPLQGLSPFVGNVNASWVGARGTEVGLLYNVFGRRLVEVGFDALPDVYEQPFHRVDATVSHPLRRRVNLKLSATNILNQPVVQKAGGLTVHSYRPGVAGAVSLEWVR